MEIAEGGELFDRIVSRGHYSEKAAAGVFRTIMKVVAQCHALGVIHRDLKPENFLLRCARERDRERETLSPSRALVESRVFRMRLGRYGRSGAKRGADDAVYAGGSWSRVKEGTCAIAARSRLPRAGGGVDRIGPSPPHPQAVSDQQCRAVAVWRSPRESDVY